MSQLNQLNYNSFKFDQMITQILNQNQTSLFMIFIIYQFHQNYAFVGRCERPHIILFLFLKALIDKSFICLAVFRIVVVLDDRRIVFCYLIIFNHVDIHRLSLLKLNEQNQKIVKNFLELFLEKSVEFFPFLKILFYVNLDYRKIQ